MVRNASGMAIGAKNRRFSSMIFHEKMKKLLNEVEKCFFGALTIAF